jgi:2-succinyl-5-enolpyruvyl-6-hydroxy-3-cyclohexene-1-carboxylate synthase
LRFSGNRGVSGIDGCTSTAIGAAMMSDKVTTLISGDVSFLYDSNAFWNKYVPDNLKVIVINNGGGGIFRIIDGPSSTDALEEFFETHHDRSAGDIAQLYKLPFYQATDESTLKVGLKWLYAQQHCAVLEVITPRLENDKILKEYFKTIKENTTLS